VRILICASAAPFPPFTGLTLVLSALVRELGARHDLRVLAYAPGARADAEHPGLRLVRPPRAGVRAELAAVASSLVGGGTLGFERLTPGMRAALTEELEGFRPDVVHVTSGRLAGLRRQLAGRPSVIVPLDAAHLAIEARAQAARGLKRLLLRLEERRVRRFEVSEYAHFDRVIVVSERDREALEALNPRLRVAVIPNGVDTDLFAPDPSASADAGRIVFTGVMSSPPNVVAAEFLARRVFPHVRAARPETRLAIVGRSPTARVRALGGLEGVEVTGEVPDVRPWLTGSRAFACPMLTGSGIKNKLLEAMAAGLPCVVTSRALGGLGVRAGREVLAGETAEELAALLVQVLGDDELAARLGQDARAYVVARHSWATVARAYERVYEEARASGGGRPPASA